MLRLFCGLGVLRLLLVGLDLGHGGSLFRLGSGRLFDAGLLDAGLLDVLGGQVVIAVVRQGIPRPVGEVVLDRFDSFADEGLEVRRRPEVEQRVGDGLVREEVLREVRNSVRFSKFWLLSIAGLCKRGRH